MKRTLLLFLCLLTLLCSACNPANEGKDTVKIKIEKISYQPEDLKISYAIVNNFEDELYCYNDGHLERKAADGWKRVLSTKPDPLAWCGTVSSLAAEETMHTMPFSDYNATLSPGTYRIALNYTISSENTNAVTYSEEFTLSGEFPLPKTNPIPADIHLAFDGEVFSLTASEITYKIVNASGEELVISPDITLMLYQNSEWLSFTYNAGADREAISTDKEIVRVISADKLSAGFENCTKIRIIEQLAITPDMRNEFFVFYEISFA